MAPEDDFGDEGARPSSLIPIHKLSTRDPLHDMQLLRDVAIINEQVRRELGPPARPALQQKPEKEGEDMKPRDLAMVALVAAGATGLTACASSTPAPSNDPDAAMRAEFHLQPVKWPLKFKEHTFTTMCYSTQICRVWYAGAWSGFREPSPPSSDYGPKYLDHIMGGHVGIANFPDPAEVTWRSMDGTEHQAHIDIGAIFRDRLVLHRVPRDEVADSPHGELTVDPLILLEVNDRTIRVYMRMSVPTKHLRVPGNPYSGYRNDLILAKTYHY
jgi:hypothetical protein